MNKKKTANRLEPPGFFRTESRKKLVETAKNLLPYKTLKSVDRFIYDISVVAHTRLQQKESKNQKRKAELSNKNLAAILETLHWFYLNDTVIHAQQETLDFFGNPPTYKEACKYFDDVLRKEYKFNSDSKIILDENSKRLICKDSSGRHILAKDNYVETRGKRLPFIKNSLENLNHCYEIIQEPGKEEQLMIINQYRYPVKIDTYNYEYFVMILRRFGASSKEYRLITAFSVYLYRGILRKIAFAKKRLLVHKMNEE